MKLRKDSLFGGRWAWPSRSGTEQKKRINECEIRFSSRLMKLWQAFSCMHMRPRSVEIWEVLFHTVYHMKGLWYSIQQGYQGSHRSENFVSLSDIRRFQCRCCRWKPLHYPICSMTPVALRWYLRWTRGQQSFKHFLIFRLLSRSFLFLCMPIDKDRLRFWSLF